MKSNQEIIGRENINGVEYLRVREQIVGRLAIAQAMSAFPAICARRADGTVWSNQTSLIPA